MIRNPISLPGSSSTLSRTTSTNVSVKVTAAGAQRVVVTGVGFSYETAFTTPVTPKIVESVTGGTVLWSIPNQLSTTFVSFFNPIVGSPGKALIATTSVSVNTITCNVTLLYYLDK